MTLHIQPGHVQVVREMLENGVELAKKMEVFFAQQKNDFKDRYNGLDQNSVAVQAQKQRIEAGMSKISDAICDFNKAVLEHRTDFNQAIRNQEIGLLNETILKRISNELKTMMNMAVSFQSNILATSSELDKAVEAARERRELSQQPPANHSLQLAPSPSVAAYKLTSSLTSSRQTRETDSDFQKSEVTSSFIRSSPEPVASTSRASSVNRSLTPRSQISQTNSSSPAEKTHEIVTKKRPIKVEDAVVDQELKMTRVQTEKRMKFEHSLVPKTTQSPVTYGLPLPPLKFTEDSFVLNGTLKKGKCVNCGEYLDPSDERIFLCVRCLPWLHYNCIDKKVIDGEGDYCFFCEKMKEHLLREYQAAPGIRTLAVTEKPVNPKDVGLVPSGSRSDWLGFYWNKFYGERNIKIGDIVYGRRLRNKQDSEEVGVFFVDFLITDAEGKDWAQVNEFIFPEHINRNPGQKFHRKEIYLTEMDRNYQYLELSAIVGPPIVVLRRQDYMTVRPIGTSEEHVYIERYFWSKKQNKHIPVKKGDFRRCKEAYSFKKLREPLTSAVWKPDMEVDSPHFEPFQMRFPLTK